MDTLIAQPTAGGGAPASLVGNRSRLGQKRSEQERAKASASLSGRKQAIIVCPHCQAHGGNALRRWHFDRCKEKP